MSASVSTCATLAASNTFLMLDPSQIGVRPPSGGIEVIIYPGPSLVIPKRNYSAVNIKSIVLNNEYYNIVDDSPYGLRNNVLTVDGNPVSLVVGNYNAASFLTMLLALLNGVGPGVYGGTYDPTTWTFTITSTVAFTLEFGPLSPYVEMGFPLGYNSGAQTSITSLNPINLSGPPNLLIEIPEINTGSMLYYNGSPFHFVYPLTGSAPSLSQANLITLGKLSCGLTGFNELYQLTVKLWYTRDGRIWPYVSWPDSSYQILLEFA